MIAVAHHFSDSGQRGIEHFAAQIHCDLAREYDLLVALLGGDVKRSDTEMISNDLDDQLRGHFFLRVRGNEILERFLRQLRRDLLVI